MKDEELPLADLEGKTIRDLLKDTNPSFFQLLKEITSLHRVRSIELCTYLLNFSISTNYFEGFRKLMREVPALLPDPENPYMLDEYLFGSERIYSIILLFSMTYKFPDRLSPDETDQKIDEIVSYGPLTNRFFMFNTILPDNYDLKLKDLLNKVKGYRQIKALLPDLAFDLEYKPVIESEALKQMFDSTFISNYLDTKLPKPLKYVPNKRLLERYRRASPTKKIFGIDYNLTISKLMTESLNLSGVHIISSKAQIDEIIRAFLKYYTTRIPSRAREIKANLLCFGGLLEFAEGRLYIKVKRQKIVKTIKKKVSQFRYDWFFKRFCMNVGSNEFGDNYSDFKPQDFLKSYNRFISYCMYDVSGVLYTGVLLIWRALIKYLEYIQLTEEFGKIKGSLLEEWCYKKAVELGFSAAKIILRNPELPSSDRYYKMKEQTKDFPEIIEEEAKFPAESDSTFEEIDLAIKIKDYIFLFECKAKRSLRGTQDIFLERIEEINTNLKSLNWKGMLIKNNSKNNYFKESFLRDINHFEGFQIQTGSILSEYKVLPPEGFVYLLQQLRN